MDSTSQSLLDRLQGPMDQTSWNKFIELYDSFLRSCLGRLEPNLPIEDLMQEIRARIVEKLPAFDHNGNPGAFRSWLRTIVHFCLKEFFRKNKKWIGSQPPEYWDGLTADNSELSQFIDREHEKEIVRKLLKSLIAQVSDRDWKIFEQYALKNRKGLDVAEEFGVTVATVIAVKRRILLLLRNEGRGLIDGLG